MKSGNTGRGFARLYYRRVDKDHSFLLAGVGLFLLAANLRPTKPLAILPAVISQPGVIAMDAMQYLFPFPYSPFHQKIRFSFFPWALHPANGPARLFLHDGSFLKIDIFICYHRTMILDERIKKDF